MAKIDNDDILLRSLLKKELPKPARNQWFTRNVINRLPARKQSYAWIEYLAYFIGGIICGIYWKELISNFSIATITVGQFLKYLLLVSATFGVCSLALYRAIIKD
ncbi:MAG: hypothetical protein PHR45_03495 [Muribaculaceae bacterium]|nr:hypothetical protein [Muribaculaceae bacterium]